MKAARVSRSGGPEVVELVDVPTPRPGAGEVLGALRAAGLNRVDVLVREGGFAAAPVPIVLGTEGAGDVAEIGPGVTGLAPGDRVVINRFVACGKCPAGEGAIRAALAAATR